MRLSLILFFCIFNYLAFCQQDDIEFYNGSFEDNKIDTCIYNNQSFNNYEVVAWQSGSKATPDYFMPCEANYFNSVPANFTGFQHADHGNAYAGFIYYSDRGLNNPYYRWVEYIAQEIGNVYFGDSLCVSFSINIADSSLYYTNTFGVYILNHIKSYTGGIPETPNFLYSPDSAKPDTSSWLKIKGKLAVTDEKIDGKAWAIFGSPFQIEDKNFFDRNWNPVEVDTTTNVGQGRPLLGYAYIDNICLSKLENCSCYNYDPGGSKPDKNNGKTSNNEKLNFPNIITPNGDGLNDFFVLSEIDDTNVEIKIYNRWGTLIYHSLNYQNNWPPVNHVETSGVYYYMVTYKNQRYKGTVTLAQ